MKHKFYIFMVAAGITCAALLSISGTRNQAQAGIDCQPPPGLGQTNTWQRGATVNVYISPAFGVSGQDVIAAQLGQWSALTNFWVNFEIKATLADMGPGALGGGQTTYYIFKRRHLRSPALKEKPQASFLAGTEAIPLPASIRV